jgi:hypothetical protein
MSRIDRSMSEVFSSVRIYSEFTNKGDYMGFTEKMAIVALFLISNYAEAELTYKEPAEGTKISSSTILKGECSGSSDVKLAGDGIDKNKKISCQKQKGKSNFWEYSLTNAYKKMDDGEVKITASQGDSSVSRTFYKNKVVVVETPKDCKLETKSIANNSSIVAYLTASVTAGQSCISESRVCKDGNLSGSYMNLACVVSTTPEPPKPPVTDLDPKKAPGQNFDLSLWKITLPLDSSGNKAGTAAEVKPIPVAFQKSPYFYTGADGAMVFMAPVDGATTSGSHYPRSELREMTASGGNAAWTSNQGGTLKATLAVNEVPKKSDGSMGRVVVGQIHGPDDELCRLYYDNGKIYFYDDKAGSSLKETQFILKSAAGAETQIPMNAKFDYSIIVANGALVVTATYNNIVYSATDKLSSFWPGMVLYYKAGVYVQVGKPGSGAGSTGSGQGQVSFYKLSKPTHP